MSCCAQPLKAVGGHCCQPPTKHIDIRMIVEMQQINVRPSALRAERWSMDWERWVEMGTSGLELGNDMGGTY